MREVFRQGGIRGNARRVGIVITDSQPTISVDLADDEAQAAQDEGIDMYAVGVTNSVNANTLEYLSSQPRILNQNYFTSADFGQLCTIVNRLLSKVCETPPITSPTTTQETAGMSSTRTLQIITTDYRHPTNTVKPLYSEIWELGTPKGLRKTVLYSEVVLFLRSIST